MPMSCTATQLLESLPAAVIACDGTGMLTQFNRTARDWHGFDAREVPADWIRLLDWYDADAAHRLAFEQTPLSRACAGHPVRQARIVIRAAGRPARHLSCDADPLRRPDGRPAGAVCVMQDVTQIVVAHEEALAQAMHLRSAPDAAAEERLRTVADNVPALIGHVGPDLRYRFVNRPYAQWFGRPVEDIVGRHMSEVLRPEHYEGIRAKLQRVLAGEPMSFEMDVVGRDGQLRHMNASYIPDTRDQRGPERGGFHLLIHDVTPQTKLARMLEERALTDELTGLPNRAAWTAELERGVEQARRTGVPVTVMFLDLDDFKRINDNHGHAAGDAVLRAFADRLRASLRQGDFIARLAGDEFVVFLDRVSRPQQDLAQVARKLVKVMEPPIKVGKDELQVRPSIGFAVQKGPNFDTAQLMQQADEAMYEAKRMKVLPYVIRA